MFQIDKCASQRYKGKIAFGYIYIIKTYDYNVKYEN